MTRGKTSAFIALLAMPALCATLPAESAMAVADRLFSSGDPARVLESAFRYARLSDSLPASYEPAWKASRAFRQACLDCRGDPRGRSPDACGRYGKLGMRYGERARGDAPGRVEGSYWYACSVACYAQGLGRISMIREGLKDKARAGFERAYAIDRRYDDGGPIKALGRYWHVLPWPLGSPRKALAYLREYQRLYPDDPEGQVYLAEVLLDMGRKDEARPLLERAAASREPYFSRRAASLLSGL